MIRSAHYSGHKRDDNNLLNLKIQINGFDIIKGRLAFPNPQIIINIVFDNR